MASNNNLPDDDSKIVESSCGACKEKDTEDMVACDRCSTWWHFACVGVGNSISEKNFLCRVCQKKPEDPPAPESTESAKKLIDPADQDEGASLAGSSTSTIRSRTKLILERLGTERELKKKQLALERQAREVELELRQLKIDEDYHQERFRCLEAQIEGGENDARSHRSTASGIRKVERWDCAAGAKNSTIQRRMFASENPGIDVSHDNQGRPLKNHVARETLAGVHVKLRENFPKSVAWQTGTIPKNSKGLVDGQPNIGRAGQSHFSALRDPRFSFDISPIQHDTRSFQLYISEDSGSDREQSLQKNTLQTFPKSKTTQPQIPIQSLRSRFEKSCHPVNERHEQPGERTRNRNGGYGERDFVPMGSAMNNRDYFDQCDPEDGGNFPIMSWRWNQAGQREPRRSRREDDQFTTRNFGGNYQEQHRVEKLGPTPQQLAARQVMPKELPQFSGSPDDWPLFISSYRTTTEACGYSDAENLMRLQRCLTGQAKEAVRCQLLLPAAVPCVMDTLETLYGRPELLVHTLLQKVRAVPAPKAERLDTLINFGMAVKNLSSYLTVANQEAHLNNPTLLFELVEKLPANLKLDWAMYKQRCARKDLQDFAAFMSVIVSAASEVTLNHDLVGSKTTATRGGRNDRPNQRNFCGTHVSEDPTSKIAEVKNQDGKFRAVEEQKQKAPETQRQSKPTCLVCKDPDHRLKECPEFDKLSVDERWKKIRNLGVC